MNRRGPACAIDWAESCAASTASYVRHGVRGRCTSFGPRSRRQTGWKQRKRGSEEMDNLPLSGKKGIVWIDPPALPTRATAVIDSVSTMSLIRAGHVRVAAL